MSIFLDQFGPRVEAAQHQLELLIQQTAQQNTKISQRDEPPAEPKLLATAVEELSTALEEINVLSEELYEQHEQLQATQDSLNRERQDYFNLFDLAPDGYLVTDAKAIIRHVNVAAATLLNRSQALLLGKPLAALIAQSDIRKFYTLLSRIQAGEVVTDIGLYLQPVRHLPIYAAFTISAVRDRQAQVAGFRWLFRDLTQQRRVTTALSQSETQYRAIVEDQSELICRSLSDGRITFANQAFCQYFDYSSESIISQSLFELMLAADREPAMRQLAGLDAANPTVTLEHRVESPGGQIRWQQWVHRALFDRENHFFQFQSAGRDITARKQAEEALQQRDVQIQALTAALPILIAYVSQTQQIVYSNQAFEPWLERPSIDMVGQALWDMLGQERYQQARVPIEKALLGETSTFEQQIERPGRKPIWIKATLIPHQIAAREIEGFFLMMIDISDQKAVEFQKEQFVAIASHELRAPLISINRTLKALKKQPANLSSAKQQMLLASAIDGSHRLAKLVDNLLDFQQMKSGKMMLEPQDCEANDLIQRAIASLDSMAQDFQIALSTRPCDLRVRVDSDRIVQVLTNLISNAIKFSPLGATVWITAKKIDHQRVLSIPAHVKFQIRDQGEGIPADRLERIFEAFNREDSSDARSQQGTGLGLAICQDIIKQHRGNITIDSRIGHGTTVSFILPTLETEIK